MKILVTGGAGYVGSHCVRALCEAGHEVVVYDDLRAGHRAAVDVRTVLVEADLANLPLLERTVQGAGFEAVMHFAASLDVGESVQHPLAYYENNVVNTVRLLRVMEQHCIRKFVFSSTCATYGIPEAVPITETMSQVPINPYGHTKLAMEWALRDSAAGWGLGACALRYFNAAGAAADATLGEDHDPELHLIPLVLQVALGQREKVQVYGTDYSTRDGTCVRDYIHVEDLASAHLLAVESQATGCFRCFNVGTGVGTTVKEIIEAARAVTGHPIPAERAPRRPGDPPELYADPTKIIRQLGWKPNYTDIQETVRTAWQWHQSHPRGFGER
ncbi:MAG: UDP-glucose 4-epimerase GalE [Planctomycetota bacterium]